MTMPKGYKYPRKRNKVVVSDKSYAELADERLAAADFYRKRAVLVPNNADKLIKLAQREELRALKFRQAHREIAGNNPA